VITVVLMVSAVALYLAGGLLTARALATRVYANRRRKAEKDFTSLDNVRTYAYLDAGGYLVAVALLWPPIAALVFTWPVLRWIGRVVDWVLWWTVGWPLGRAARFVMTPIREHRPEVEAY
jgi:hypothetical protein